MSDLELQMSSTTLGYEGEGGKAGAAIALAEEIISPNVYTDIVVKNAQKAKEITEKEFPEATFGVSALASAINPEVLHGAVDIKSVDYPYYVDLFSKELFKIKQAEVDRQGRTGFSRIVSYAQEYAYAMLQSPTEKNQINSSVNAAKLISDGSARLRTCLAMTLSEKEMAKIREVNSRLGDDKPVIWAIEPNRGVEGGKDLNGYVNMLTNVMKDPKNRNLKFGIDLDLGGLPEEDRSLLELLDTLDSHKLLPVFVSLSAQEHVESGFRTHLPLGESIDYGRKLGEWIKTRQARGLKLPAFVIETSPADQDVLGDYANFLANLKAGAK